MVGTTAAVSAVVIPRIPTDGRFAVANVPAAPSQIRAMAESRSTISSCWDGPALSLTSPTGSRRSGRWSTSSTRTGTGSRARAQGVLESGIRRNRCSGNPAYPLRAGLDANHSACQTGPGGRPNGICAHQSSSHSKRRSAMKYGSSLFGVGCERVTSVSK